MFSQIVDETIMRSGRRDRLVDIISFVNHTIWELHTTAYYPQDFKELTIVLVYGYSQNFVYEWALPFRYRALRAVRYDGYLYPQPIMPGKRMQGRKYYYYRSGQSIILVGANSKIDIGYYDSTPTLRYYPNNERPAIYDLASGVWQYLVSPDTYAFTLGSTLLDEAAQNLVISWLMYEWKEAIMQGSLAKLYNALGDARGSNAFGLFQQMKNDLVRTYSDGTEHVFGE